MSRRSALASIGHLLPGGSSDPTSGLVVSLMIWAVFGLVGLIAGLIVSSQTASAAATVSAFSVANAFPAAVLGLWVLARVRGSVSLEPEQVAIDPLTGQFFHGATHSRVPERSLVMPLGLRATPLSLADGRALRLFWRISGEPEDALAAARLIKSDPARGLEALVGEKAQALAGELLPDPDGVQQALAGELLRHGVIVTRLEP